MQGQQAYTGLELQWDPALVKKPGVVALHESTRHLAFEAQLTRMVGESMLTEAPESLVCR